MSGSPERKKPRLRSPEAELEGLIPPELGQISSLEAAPVDVRCHIWNQLHEFQDIQLVIRALPQFTHEIQECITMIRFQKYSFWAPQSDPTARTVNPLLTRVALQTFIPLFIFDLLHENRFPNLQEYSLIGFPSVTNAAEVETYRPILDEISLDPRARFLCLGETPITRLASLTSSLQSRREKWGDKFLLCAISTKRSLDYPNNHSGVTLGYHDGSLYFYTQAIQIKPDGLYPAEVVSQKLKSGIKSILDAGLEVSGLVSNLFVNFNEAIDNLPELNFNSWFRRIFETNRYWMIRALYYRPSDITDDAWEQLKQIRIPYLVRQREILMELVELFPNVRSQAFQLPTRKDTSNTNIVGFPTNMIWDGTAPRNWFPFIFPQTQWVTFRENNLYNFHQNQAEWVKLLKPVSNMDEFPPAAQVPMFGPFSNVTRLISKVHPHLIDQVRAIFPNLTELTTYKLIPEVISFDSNGSSTSKYSWN